MTIRIKHTTTKNQRLPGNLGLSYAAGMLDGEGCICIAKTRSAQSKNGYNYRLRVIASQNHLRTLTDFQDLVGIEGLLYQITRSPQAHRDQFQLIYDGDKAAELLSALQPYLGRKQSEAVVALQYQSACEVNRRFGRAGCPDSLWKLRESYYRKLRSMK